MHNTTICEELSPTALLSTLKKPAATLYKSVRKIDAIQAMPTAAIEQPILGKQ